MGLTTDIVNTKILLVISFLGILIFPGCVDPERTIVIDDLSKEKRQVLISKQEHPYAIRLKIKRQTDGSFSVIGINLKGGVIDTDLLVDWYSDTLMFHYKPITAKKGHLKIQYYF